MPQTIVVPLTTPDALRTLKIGDTVRLEGTLYTARDAAHRRLCALLRDGQPLPIPLQGQAIYYCGPCPAPPGRVIGSCGPTTSGRMDSLTPPLLAAGARVLIGKGPRSTAVGDALRKAGGVYIAAYGGAGALLAACVTACEPVAFPELGPEAIYRLTVTGFPGVVAMDAHGGDVYARGAVS